jgi:hypothetical protein
MSIELARRPRSEAVIPSAGRMARVSEVSTVQFSDLDAPRSVERRTDITAQAAPTAAAIERATNAISSCAAAAAVKTVLKNYAALVGEGAWLQTVEWLKSYPAQFPLAKVTLKNGSDSDGAKQLSVLVQMAAPEVANWRQQVIAPIHSHPTLEISRLTVILPGAVCNYNPSRLRDLGIDTSVRVLFSAEMPTKPKDGSSGKPLNFGSQSSQNLSS